VEDTYTDPLTRISRHGNSPITERELSTAEVEIISCAHILQEAWDRKGKLAKEGDLESLEERGGHPRKESFQVSGRTFKHKAAKVRKGDVSKN